MNGGGGTAGSNFSPSFLGNQPVPLQGVWAILIRSLEWSNLHPARPFVNLVPEVLASLHLGFLAAFTLIEQPWASWFHFLKKKRERREKGRKKERGQRLDSDYSRGCWTFLSILPFFFFFVFTFAPSVCSVWVPREDLAGTFSRAHALRDLLRCRPAFEVQFVERLSVAVCVWAPRRVSVWKRRLKHPRSATFVRGEATKPATGIGISRWGRNQNLSKVSGCIPLPTPTSNQFSLSPSLPFLQLKVRRREGDA